MKQKQNSVMRNNVSLKAKFIDKITLNEYSESIRSAYGLGLTGYLKSHANGKEATARSPLFKKFSAGKVWDMWLSELAKHRDEYPELIAYEYGRMSKIGPQGSLLPIEDRLEDLAAYWDFNRDKPTILKNKSYWDKVKRKAEQMLGILHSGHLRPVSLETALKEMRFNDKLDTNSGWPDFSKRSNREVMERALADAHSEKYLLYPAILGSRSSRQKSRFIFMFPMATNLVEATYTLPLMKWLRERNKVSRYRSLSAWEGFGHVTAALSRSLGVNLRKYQSWDGNGIKSFTQDSPNDHNTRQFWCSIDYSKMDTTVGPWQSQMILDFIKPWFQQDVKIQAGLNRTLNHVNSINVLITESHVARRTHGYASGSGWTNLGESLLSSLVHAHIALTLDRVYGLELIADQINGDDGVMVFNKSITSESVSFDDISKVIVDCIADFGLRANAEKQDIETSRLHYLQRFFDWDLQVNTTQGDYLPGCYPTVLALNAGMFPERYHSPEKWDARMEILRWIMILENCNMSPLFHDIIQFFMKGDRYRLGLDYPGFFSEEKLNSLYKEAKAIKGFVPSYNQAKVDKSIFDFETVKYLIQLKHKG